MENKNDFEYKYSAPTSSERKEIESIRDAYKNPHKKSMTKLEFLRKLDSRVKNIPIMLGLIVGIIGTLIFGLGMTLVLEWGHLVWGIIVCSVGVVPISLAYFTYQKSSKHMKGKYADQIISLSEELLNEEN